MTEINKSDLKGPDAFQVRIYRAIDWMVANKRQVGVFLLPLVVVTVAGFAWQAWSNHMKNRRIAELATIEDAYANESRDASKKAEPGAYDKVIPDHSASLASYTAFAAKNPGTEEGWTAGLRAANILLDKETPDHELARKQLEAVVAKSVASPFHQIMGRFVLLSVLEDTKQYDEALKQVTTLAGILDPKGSKSDKSKAGKNGSSLLAEGIRPQLLLSKARIELAKNAKDEARATLKVILDDHKNSEAAATARAMLSMAAAN